MRIGLLLPPSVNALYFNLPRGGRAYSYKGNQYMNEYMPVVQKRLQELQHVPFDQYFYLDCYFYLPRRNCDAHNYFKGLLDMLEKAEFMTDDRYAMVRTQSVGVDTKNPRVEIEWAHDSIKT